MPDTQPQTNFNILGFTRETTDKLQYFRIPVFVCSLM